jgi:hypothetical protein
MSAAAPLLRQVALVSESNRVDLKEIAIVAAALQKQASRDFAPIWDVTATVDAFAALEDVPLGYWPMIVKDDIGFAGAAGIHLDRNGQPFALITASDDNNAWSLTASHEALEMLADPFGNRQIPGDSPKPDQGRVSFLVEVCDPSEAADFAYSVNGVLVSDFYTPRFFDPVIAPGIRYSFTGAIKQPRQVLRGGYLSWFDPASGNWWQETWFFGDHSQFSDLGSLTSQSGSIRAQIDRITEAGRREALSRGRSAALAAGLTVRATADSTRGQARAWREQIDQIVGASRAAGPTPTSAIMAATTMRRSPGQVEGA